jgi:NhaC family Na+:H+ antiporter
MADESTASPETTASPNVKKPSYADCIIPLVVLIALISGSVTLYGARAVEGPMQVALILSSMCAMIIILKNGHSWNDIVESGSAALASVASAISILLAVGALIGAWNMSGTIPTIVFYGIQLLQPSYFYVATAILCAMVSLCTGSSWTTVGTIGVGLVGIASLVGVSPAITAGAILSGAYLGDKISNLSETTVLASQLAGVDIHTHIRAAVWTSGPAFLVAIIVFAILGLRESPNIDTGYVSMELSKLDQLFWITPLNLLPLVVLLVLSLRKAPASLSIMASAIIAGIMAAIFQPQAIARFLGEPVLGNPAYAIKGIWSVMATGYRANAGIPELDTLLSRGGMSSMLNTLWIIIGAVTFGTMLEEFGLLSKLIDPVLRRAHSTGRLIATVVGTALGLNIVAADQYIAIVLPARLFRVEFLRRGLKPQNLSRACADAGTVTSPLIQWNSCGAYMSATLGVATLAYLPFAVFNLASPIISLLWGFTGFKIERMPPAQQAPEREPVLTR